MGYLEQTLPGDSQLASLQKLAEELAIGAKPPAEIWASHGIKTREEAQRILSIPAFRTMITEIREEWQATHNITERIRVRSLMALEEGLLPLYQAAISNANPLSSRKDTFAFFAKLGGLEKQDLAAVSGPGGGVTIHIDLSTVAGASDNVVCIDANTRREEREALTAAEDASDDDILDLQLAERVPEDH